MGRRMLLPVLVSSMLHVGSSGSVGGAWILHPPSKVKRPLSDASSCIMDRKARPATERAGAHLLGVFLQGRVRLRLLRVWLGPPAAPLPGPGVDVLRAARLCHQCLQGCDIVQQGHGLWAEGLRPATAVKLGRAASTGLAAIQCAMHVTC